MIGWLIAIAVLLLIWFLPLGISAVYNASGPAASMLIGPFRLKLYPKKGHKNKKKQKAEDTSAVDETAQNTNSDTANDKKQKGGSYKDFFPIVKLVLEFLGDFRRKLRVKRLELKVIMAGSDPCDLAVNYGKAWAAIGNLYPQLERVFVIQKRDVEVECDFTADKTVIFARLDLTITVGRILRLGLWHGVRILKEFLKISKTRKGGTSHESKSS